MAKRNDIKAGATDQTVDVFIQDSSSTTGAGLSGLVYNSAGLTCYYRKGATGSAVQLTLATQTVGGAHSDGGFVQIDATNMKGVYRLDLSDTIIATAGMVVIYLFGATNMAPVVLELEVQPATGKQVDVVSFGGAAATTASGRPEVNTTHLAGSAVDQSGGLINANVKQISGDATAADNLEAAADGTTYNLGGGAIVAASVTGAVGSVTGAVGSVTGAVGSVTGNVGGNVTGSVGSVASGGIAAASFAAGAIDAAAIAADAIGSSELAASAVTEIQSGLATASAVSTLQSDVTTLLGRITSTLFTGITSLAEWLGLIAGKQTGNTTARTEIRATGAGSGSFDETTDSQEALRDRGDAAWITATGFSTLDAAGVRSAVGLASANLDTQLAALPTAGENADQVWEEALTDHSGTPGSTAEALGAAGSAGDPWATALPGAYSAGQAGKIVGDNLNTTVSSRATQTTADAIEADTQDLQARTPAALVGGRTDASVGAMAVDTVTASALAASAVSEIQSGLSTLDAAAVRTAVGLASANLDTQLDAIPTNADLATALGTADDAVLAAIAALTIPTAAQNAAALLDLSNGVETGLTPRQAFRLMVAAAAGKLSGAATTTIVIRNAVADSKDRITATVDASGNRSAVSVDVT